MKAMIRNKGETICESDGIEGIDWKTGMPMTNEKWHGGPYKLIDNYTPPVDEEDTVQLETEVKEEIVEDDSYVIIDGKRYSKEELRSLLE